MDAISGALVLILPIAGAMLLALGIFQVAMDLRGNTQKKVVDRLNEFRPKAGGLPDKELLLRKRAGDEQGHFLEYLRARSFRRLPRRGASRSKRVPTLLITYGTFYSG